MTALNPEYRPRPSWVGLALIAAGVLALWLAAAVLMIQTGGFER